MPVAVGARVKKSVYDSPEELDLVHRAKSGDNSAFDVLYKAHHGRVVISINRLVKDEDLAEWLANNALKNVWRGLPKFKEQSKFSTWIIRIAINEAKMHLRSSKRRQHDVSLDGLLSTDETSSDAGYAQRWLAIRDLELEGIADRQLLERAIRRVPEQFREIIRLRYWEGLTTEEIRVKVSAGEPELVSIAAVKSRLLRARKLLMKQVEKIS